MASVSPMVARTPSLPYCRSVSPASWAACVNAAALAEGEPHEVRLGLGDEPALHAQGLHDAGALGDDRVDPLLQLVERAQRRHSRRLRERVDPERDSGLAEGCGNGLVRHGIPDPQARQAVGLREGAQHDDVGAVAVEGQGVGRLLVVDELEVGLVDDDEHVGRDSSRNRSSSSWWTIGPVGLFGVQTSTTGCGR